MAVGIFKRVVFEIEQKPTKFLSRDWKMCAYKSWGSGGGTGGPMLVGKATVNQDSKRLSQTGMRV